MDSSSARHNIFLFILVGLSLVVLPGFGCRRAVGPSENLDEGLIVWGLWQESTDMDVIGKAFEQQTGVKVNYKKISSVASYEKMLLEALAQGRGPDVFVIHHTWVEGKRGLLSPAPTDIIDERALGEEFVEVVKADTLRDNLVYALPTSVDTLALYYNKDILAAGGVATPPTTWDEMQRVVERVTKVSRLGVITQSALSAGAAANVNRAPDILQLLMLQSGLPLINTQGRAELATDVGERALTFYTDFSNKSKRVFTWDLQQDFSLDAFAAGKTAMMLNYSYHLPTITAKNPRLKFATAAMPHIADGQVINFASYWPFAVSTTSRAPITAWRFVRFLTSKEPAAALNKAQGVPPARRDSISDLNRDPLLGPFAEQALTATAWPRVDIVATDAIFNKMIDDVVTGAASIPESLTRAQDQLNQLITKE